MSNERDRSGRIRWCSGLLCLALAGLIVRLYFLHLRTDQAVRDRVTQRRSLEKNILPVRGTIFDAAGRGNILVLNVPAKHVCLDPSAIVQSNRAAEVAGALSKLLDLPTETVLSKLDRPDRRFEYAARYVPLERAEAVARLKLPGVFFEEASLRYYPHGSFMCHALGFVNYEGIGCSGVEQCLDDYLRGSAGLVEGRLNALREEVYSMRDSYLPALEGADAILTIDQHVQYILERTLAEAVRDNGAKGAWGIVERVRTGDILAMASYPVFDLNEFSTARPDALLNRAIGTVYEPGSTFKATVISAALNEEIVTPETVFDCENGAWGHAGRVLRDYHPYGRLTVADGVKKSSNILTAKVAVMLGERRMYQYLRDFGIGKKSGVDLPGEECGILHHVSRWSKVSSSRIAIGQGVAVTALQMLGVFCAIANDGILMKPRVVRQIVARDGTVLRQPQPERLGRPITAQTAATMRRLLSRVTEEGGTGHRARVEGYTVAGKTGTAQKPENGGYSTTAHVASFVGFLPAEDPEVAIIVVIDEPADYHTGGVVAGPAFSRVASQTVRYLDIPPVSTMVAGTRAGRTRD